MLQILWLGLGLGLRLGLKLGLGLGLWLGLGLGQIHRMLQILYACIQYLHTNAYYM